jgi:hypothetical protein
MNMPRIDGFPVALQPWVVNAGQLSLWQTMSIFRNLGVAVLVPAKADCWCCSVWIVAFGRKPAGLVKTHSNYGGA